MNGTPVADLFDYVVDVAGNIVEDKLAKKQIVHTDAYLSRKIITRAVDALNRDKPNGNFNGKNALCINFEDNLPDLGVIMSEIISRHCGYNTYNTGSHAEIGDLESVLRKKSVDTLIFYLCDRQCCMASTEKNLNRTEKQVISLVESANHLQVKTIFGGRGLKLFPKLDGKIDHTFLRFSELKKIL